MFSIIIPCHNYGSFLNNCVESIDFNNNFLEEVIIINDNSSDETENVIDALKKKEKIKTFNVNFNSLPKTINFAANMVNSKYFSRIDPDDTYHALFFKELVNNNIENNFEFIYGDLQLKKGGNIQYVKQNVNNLKKLFFHPLSNGTLISKKKFIEIGGINQNLNFKDDYDLWLKLQNSNSLIKYISVPTFIYNRHQRNMSNNLIKKKLSYLNLLIRNLI
jgi:glycosyltransferase involved in cell wall biosynthesis